MRRMGRRISKNIYSKRKCLNGKNLRRIQNRPDKNWMGEIKKNTSKEILVEEIFYFIRIILSDFILLTMLSSIFRK